MCFVYLAPENTSLRLNRNMTRGSHHEPFMLVEAATDAIVASDIDNETAVNVGMYMYYSWTRTRTVNGTAITPCFRTPFVFGHPLFFTEIIMFSVRKHRVITVYTCVIHL